MNFFQNPPLLGVFNQTLDSVYLYNLHAQFCTLICTRDNLLPDNNIIICLQPGS